MGEVKSLIDSFYGGSGEAPPYEAEALMRLLDTNRDGRISWDEFSAALGAKNDSARDFPLRALSAAVEGNAVGAPNVTGTITVSLEGGKEVEVDAASYMEQLKAEAEVLRKELNMVRSSPHSPPLKVSAFTLHSNLDVRSRAHSEGLFVLFS
eukprot:scaffold154615_cov34-Tisochrysis_lutea.AAC.3